MKNYNQEYERWLNSEALTKEEKNELLSIKNDEETKELRFSSPMGFGTAGLRSTMYLGIGNMNRFTVAQTTRGLAALIKSVGAEDRNVAICYDSRNNSELFAKISASVLAGAGIKSYIFNGLRPTPELSFAVRELNSIAGINVTASHNPKEYNGYKAYWEDGAQIGPEQAKVVSEARSAFDVLDMSGIMDYEEAKAAGLVTELDESFDEKYLNAVIATMTNKNIVKEVSDYLKVVYSPLHGAGYKLVPEVFKRVGLKHLYTVSEQMIPDGNFPTVEKPNPEYANVFALGIKIADEVGSDLVIATDPDSDRVGVMARTKDGSFATISGNQMGALLLDYVINQKKAIGTLPENAYCVKSIVSTEMANKIAEANGIKIHEVLTGFKYIGETIKNYEARGEKDGFLLGFEESYGYLLGSYARDKDAVGASMSILEMTAYYRTKGLTLSDALNALYEKYGFFAEKTIDIYMEGLDGIERQRRMMLSLRENAPKAFAGSEVAVISDYKSGDVTSLKTGAVTKTGQPASDVLVYKLVSGDKIIVRPSGTEPKVKIYILASDTEKARLDAKMELYAKEAKKLADA